MCTMNRLSPVYHLCISVSIMNIYLLPVTYLLSINILSMCPLSTIFLPTTINFPCFVFSKLFLPAFLFKISFILNSFNGSPVNICSEWALQSVRDSIHRISKFNSKALLSYSVQNSFFYSAWALRHQLYIPCLSFLSFICWIIVSDTVYPEAYSQM